MRIVVDEQLWEQVAELQPITVPEDMTPQQVISQLQKIRDFYNRSAETARAAGSGAYPDWPARRAEHVETEICWLEQKGARS